MKNYVIESLPDYFKQYKKSIKNPKKFWDKVADENFVWYQRWEKVVKYDMREAKIEWFINAKMNITKNCIDRHLAQRGNKTAIIWEPNDPNEPAQHITYQDLYDRVGKMSNVLRDMGVQKG
ncbi:MAG TPA: acetyl-coenzyme A synthetase N-terminal domain-containing protein, partial [Niabella sp.]|nr:acetyl-coenzyme A synthetase N-terminal domain-containing protein [Niabella sp.]